MNAHSVSRVFVAVLATLALAACERKLTGPSPTVTGVTPAAVCTEQLTTAVAIAGDGLSPLLTDGLTASPQLNLPAVSLVLEKDLAGAAASADPVIIPDNPAAPDASHARWTSQQSMEVDVFPALSLAPGLYSLHVANRNGHAADFADAVLGVPPPSLAAATPDLMCNDEPADVVLTGDFFIRSASLQPTVTVGTLTLAPKAMADCRALPGPAGLEACKSLTVTIAAKALGVGTHAFVVHNPQTVACASTSTTVTVTVVPDPTLASVVPDFTCTAQGATAVVATGTGFLSVDAATASLVIGTQTYAGTLAGCTDVTGIGLREHVQSCTTLRASIPMGDLPPTGAFSNFPAKVVNPAPASCETKEQLTFTTVPAPTLTSVVPDLVCTASGAVSVTVNGTGFISAAPDATTTPTLPQVTVGSLTLTPTAAAGCTAVTGPLETVQSCTALTVLIPQGSAIGSQSVTVTNPAPAGCSSTQAITVAIAPPPVVTALAPDITTAAEADVSVALTGTGFIKIGATLPGVQVGAVTLAASAASGCTAIAGTTTGAESCTGLTVVVPRGSPTGEQPVVVVNPLPASCSSAPKKLYLAPAPALARLTPPGLCIGTTGTTAVTLDGADFLRLGGTALPTVTIGAHTYVPTMDAASCTAVTGYSQTIDRCARMTIDLPSTDFPTSGSFDAVVRNPAPAAASSTPPLPFSVTVPPTLTSVVPTRICAGGGSLTLTGTNFTSTMQVTLASPTPEQAVSVTVTGGTTAVATFAGPLPVGGPYDVKVTTATGACNASLTAQVTVTPGPVVYFVDPPVVYNGITTQATVYASGFSANGLTVSIRVNGSGTLQPVTSAYNPTKANRILITLPQGLTPGSYDVLVSDAVTTQCPGQLPNAFRVVGATTLVLTGIEPPFGYTGAPTAVTISADGTAGGGLKPLPRIYLNPSSGTGVAIPLEAVSLISATTATAVVPAGEQVGTYDLIVVNPDGGVGVLTMAFKVLPDPLPFIDTVSPQYLISQQTAAPFAIAGGNFRAPVVTLRCKDTTGNALSVTAALVGTPTATAINATANTTTLPNGTVCVVRATNGDGSYADFSAIAITNPAQKPTGFTGGPAMLTARRALVSEGGSVTRAAQFLYALGGDDGAATPASFDTAESAPLDIYGVPGQFFAQRYRLTVPRAYAAGQRIGRWLYVAGGRSGATVHSTVERSYLLDPKDRVTVTDLDLQFSEVTGLPGGIYTYRVSAVMGPTDTFNPSGENLPSDPFPINLPVLSGINTVLTLHWAAVPGAVKYRVYRTAVNGAAGTELLLAEVTAPATSYTDDGAVTPAGQGPLPVGSTGVWTVAGTLPAAREGAAATVVADPTTAGLWYLYVVGGRDGAGAVQNTAFKVPVTVASDASQTVGTITASANTLGTARWELGVVTASPSSAPVVGTAQWVYAYGGNTGTVNTGAAQAAQVMANGDLGPWTTVNTMSPTRSGFAPVVVNGYLYGFGGLQSGSTTPDNGGSSSQLTTPQPALTNWQNTSAQMTAHRFLPGSTMQGAFFYVLGGKTDVLSATQTTDRIVW